MKKVMFFRPMYYMGGTEIAILNLIKRLEGFEIYIGYTDSTSSNELLEQYKEYAKIVKINPEEKFTVDILIICTPYISVWPLIENIERTNTYLWFHHFGNRDVSIFKDESLLDNIDKFIVVSETAKNIILRQSYGEKIKSKLCIIYNVLNVKDVLNKAKEPIDLELSNTLNLVTVSRICFEKGFQRILLLANELKKQNVDFKWFIVGGNYYKDVEDKIKKMFEHLKEHFVFFGFLDNPYNIIRQCDYLVLLSDNETWGLTLTEAKILRVPSIVTDFEVAYEQIFDNETGIIINRNDTSYSDKIDKILEKKEELKNNLNDFKYSNVQTIKRWNKLLSK